MKESRLPGNASLKLELMFEGIRFSPALGQAADHSFPNFSPYRFSPGEHDPGGTGQAVIPYLLCLDDGTLVRIMGQTGSPWWIDGGTETGYSLRRDGEDQQVRVGFTPLPEWMKQQTSDGRLMSQTGISLHGDMAVINLTPGCDYFLAPKRDGLSMRCRFCSYGAPDERTRHLGQQVGNPRADETAIARMQETLTLALSEQTIRHIYLVGGSLPDWTEEADRYLHLAEAVQSVVGHQVPVTCGSGALPELKLRELHASGLVDSVCFNLEVWSEKLFASVCPGKHHFVGYQNWLESLQHAVSLWGRERVYTAMVAGIELEPEYEYSPAEATALALEGAEWFLGEGIVPVYSLYWPMGGRERPDYHQRLRSYFTDLNLGTRKLREQYSLAYWDGFMCHQCAYMQLECDLDRPPNVLGETA